MSWFKTLEGKTLIIETTKANVSPQNDIWRDALVRRESPTYTICLCLHSMDPFCSWVQGRVKWYWIPFSFKKDLRHKNSWTLSIWMLLRENSFLFCSICFKIFKKKRCLWFVVNRIKPYIFGICIKKLNIIIRTIKCTYWIWIPNIYKIKLQWFKIYNNRIFEMQLMYFSYNTRLT